ncbi:hypothetical protein QVD17_12070 [Tagetes erecta]|uniref:Uncharacterized protein n=1 Tax=Tagetes erecta TaxID=13708 RepID=A0AAD8KYJ8_TARER|nr:hypothetical protein QVD17_12070 [Tagetes erecta]
MSSHPRPPKITTITNIPNYNHHAATTINHLSTPHVAMKMVPWPENKNIFTTTYADVVVVQHHHDDLEQQNTTTPPLHVSMLLSQATTIIITAGTTRTATYHHHDCSNIHNNIKSS